MKNQAYELYELPQIRDLKDMVYTKAKNLPEKTAFTFIYGRNKRSCRTYRQFCDEMNELGTWLFMHGFRDRHIAVIGENSYEWLLTFFAVANSGNVAVPIDKELPKQEIRRLLDKADVTVVFCSKDYLDLVEDLNEIEVFSFAEMNLYLLEGQQGIQTGIKSYLEYTIDADKTCCIIFTSGTSGASKGVMLSQKNLAFEINNTCRLFVLEGNTIALLPFHHAFGLVVGVFMVFNYGYIIHINRSLKNVSKALKESKPQTLFVVPLFVEMFHKQIWETARQGGKEKQLRFLMSLNDMLLKMGIDIRTKCFAAVREAFGGNIKYIISGGAGIPTFYIREFRSFGIEILNGYGTTECSPCAAVNRNYHHKDGTVGLPVPGTKIKIAEDGEVLIWGGHVMQGYYKDSVSTGEVLNNGWYATGDIGHLDKDGFLTLVGRKKNLIILSNGENISPEELEQDFLKNQAVREVVVYEKDGVIAAEIYPDEAHMHDFAYFNEVMRTVNNGRPMYKQVSRVYLRDTEFEKNTSMKIIRYKK